MTYSRVLCSLVLLVAVAAGAQVTVQFCQPGAAGIREVHVYNYGITPPPTVGGMEPTPTPPRYQIITLGSVTPVPTQYQAVCGTDPGTAYVAVPAAASLVKPGWAVSLLAWAVSSDGIGSVSSNGVAKTPVPLAPPQLLP